MNAPLAGRGVRHCRPPQTQPTAAAANAAAQVAADRPHTRQARSACRSTDKRRAASYRPEYRRNLSTLLPRCFPSSGIQTALTFFLAGFYTCVSEPGVCGSLAVSNRGTRKGVTRTPTFQCVCACHTLGV